jgi:hypothetical protein
MLIKNNFISYDSAAIGRDLEPGTYGTTTKEINTYLGKAKVPGPIPGQGSPSTSFYIMTIRVAWNSI